MSSLLASLQETLTFVQNWQEALSNEDNEMNMCEIKDAWQKALVGLTSISGQSTKKLFSDGT